MKNKLAVTGLVFMILTLVIQPYVRYTPIKGQRFYDPASVASSSIFRIKSNEDILLRSGEWRRIPTGLSLDIPRGYHGHLYPIEPLTRDGIHLLTSFIQSGVNQTLAPVFINMRHQDYMLTGNRTIVFIAFLKHLVQSTLEEIKI